MNNKDYDEVKRVAAIIMPLIQMGNAMSNMGKYQEAFKYYKDARSKAKELLDKYGDMEAVYVVYSSAVVSLFNHYLHLYEEQHNNRIVEEMIELCAEDINVMKQIDYQNNLIRSCSMIMMTAYRSTVAFHVFLNTCSELLDGNHIKLVLQNLYDFLFLTTKEVERIEPDSPQVEIALSWVNRLHYDGFDIEDNKSIDDIEEIMSFLAQAFAIL